MLLTFDDGPTPDVTPEVLDRLAGAGARALFFVVGKRLAAAPGLLRRVVEAGHAVGNHSWHHDTARFPAPGRYLRDMVRCSDDIERACGVRPVCFRAPEGRLHPASWLGPGRLGLRHVLWSLDSMDWTVRDAAAAREAGGATAAAARDGDIVLLHEYSRTTLDLLDVLLPALAARGFDLSTGLESLLTGGD